MFASDTADTNPSTNGNGSAGVFVKVSAGNLDQDPITYADNGYLGKTDYPFVGAAQYPSVPLTFTAATNDAPVLGITLNQTILEDENGEKLLYNPVKASELQAVLSGQAAPVATKGLFTLDEGAFAGWDNTNCAPNSVLYISSTAGKVTGLADSSSSQITGLNVVGKILATGQRSSQNGASDQFAGTTTGKYALVQIDCTRPQLA
jgi:hypothetical protein